MYPDLDVQSSVKIVIEKILKLKLSKNFEKRSIGFHQITHLKGFLNDES